MSRLRTPIIKPRTQGGTFYTFGSALEDVGLNINELKNKVALSHYVLLNLPEFEGASFEEENINVGDYTFAQEFQNYVLNMETVLRNQPAYNFAESRTVSERVFWKWMQKKGFIEFEETKDGYYHDSKTYDADGVIKGFGLISAGAQRTDAYGIYNETFVQIPSSFGQIEVLLKPVSDKNYYINKTDELFESDTTGNYIENIDESEVSDNKLHTGISALAEYDEEKGYRVENELDELCVEFSLSELRKYYDDETLRYDDLGIVNSINDKYEFNSVLVYYSIYDSTGKNILATNAYGLLLLDSASNRDGESNMYSYPTFTKKKSGTNNAGNSYSFRINAKTSSVYSGDVKVTDNSVPGYAMSEDFNDMIRNLSVAVETLRSNANLISVFCDQNATIKELTIKSLDKIDDIEKDIMTLKTGKVKELKTSLLITDALSANTLDSSLTIGDYGTIDGSVFGYDTVKATNLEATDASIEAVTVTTINAKNEEILFDDFGKITSGGLYTNGLYLNAETSEADNMNSTDAVTIINSLIPKKDGNFDINTNISSQTTSSNNIGINESESEVSDKTGVNVKTLLASIVKRLQTLSLFDLSQVDSSTEIITNIIDTLDGLYEKFDDIDSSLNILNSELNEVNSKVNTIDSSISEIETALDNHTSAFSDIDTNMDLISNDVSTLFSDYTVLEGRVSDVEAAVSSIDSSIAILPDLDSNIQVLDSSVQALDTSMQSQASLVNDLSTNLNALNIFIGAEEMSRYGSLRELIADIVENGA